MSDRFINPYTFVPLPKDGAARSIPACSEPVFSGEIRCTLKAMTQIAVPDELKNPCASDDDRTEPKKYGFFGYEIDGKRIPVIPGSGLRGVIRSVFETLTDSCLRLNDSDKDYFHTRLNKTSPGIIEFDGQNYVLFEAERFRDKTRSTYKTGAVVRFFSKPGDNNASELVDMFSREGDREGVYLRVDTFKTRSGFSHPSVFEKGNLVEAELDKRCVDRLKVNVEMYKGRCKDDYKKAIENMEKHGGQLPAWYYHDKQNGHYYFAPSQFSRAVFVNQPKDFVERANVNRCSSSEICEACALFGFIGEESRASRVRFTDALCQTENPSDGAYILPVLATPRLSSFEFYLDGNGSKKFGADTPGVTLRGRKFYRHQPNAKITGDDDFAKAHPKMASEMELVRSGTEFEFSVFFDKITEVQLKKLVFALNLGGNKNALCHKLGHGKPIGLGSVKIAVESVVKRSFKNGEYSVEDVTEQILPEAKLDLFRQSDELTALLDRVLDFGFTQRAIVDYPRTNPKGTPGDEIFKWFAQNREGMRSKGYIEIKKLLPKITDEDQTLKRSYPNKNKNNPNGGRR